MCYYRMYYELSLAKHEIITSDSDSEFEPGQGGGRKKRGEKKGKMTDFSRATTGRKRGVISYKESSHSNVSDGEDDEMGRGEGAMMVAMEIDPRDGIERVLKNRIRNGKLCYHGNLIYHCFYSCQQ